MKTLYTSLKVLLLLTLLTGVLYPLAVTGINQLLFPEKANGSLIRKGEQIIGSELIGQSFDSLRYFSSRPSAIGYNPLPSSGSNYGPTNAKLKGQFEERKLNFIGQNQLESLADVPSEMLFASGSGLDPHISPQSAFLQADRVALIRNFNPDQKKMLIQSIKDLSEGPQYFCFGEPRINVLLLNLKVDSIQ